MLSQQGKKMLPSKLKYKVKKDPTTRQKLRINHIRYLGMITIDSSDYPGNITSQIFVPKFHVIHSFNIQITIYYLSIKQLKQL